MKRGLTHISHIAVLAPKITSENAGLFLKELPGKAERQVRELAAAVNKDGSRSDIEPLFDIRLRFTREQLAALERARELLSSTGRVPSEEEAIIKSIEDLLEKRDPLRKAARSETRAKIKVGRGTPTEMRVDLASASKKTRSIETTLAPYKNESVVLPSVPKANAQSRLKSRRRIPAEKIRKVWMRDGDCCAHILANGRRCAAKFGLQIDHVRPLAFGQDNRLENLRVICRECNVAEAERLLGTPVMERYRWLQARTGGVGYSAALIQ